MTDRDPVAAARPGEIAAAEQMAAAATGDVEAFAGLAERYTPLLMGVALRIVGDRNDAEKAVHEVLVEAWRSSRFYDPARFSVRVWWTIGIRAMALRRSQGRRTKRMASTHDTMIAQLAPGPESTDISPLRAHVRRVLDALSSEQRSVVQLAYFDGLSATEIGDRSRLNPVQVRAMLAEALRCMRTGLFWIDAPSVGPADELAAGYLLSELAADERSALELGDRVRGLEAGDAAIVRDTVHSLALYTIPGPAAPRIRTRLIAAITGPDRLQLFAVDLARFLAVDLARARETLTRVDRPQGWLDDAAGVRVLALDLNQGDPDVVSADVSSDMSADLASLETTMVQSPAWPAICLLRLAPGQKLGARYPVGGARVLVLQGALLGSDGRRARPGERWTWPAGASLGAANPGEVELICAVRAGAAQA
jgi:RNA polymerase sigma-70 factor (ECF subfamily)